MAGTLEIVRDGTVALVWLNRPEQHNALASELVAELTSTLHALALEAEVP